MKLLFHIGLNKSGSSFLQGLFDYNRALLYNNNISYPYSYSRQYSTNGTDIAFALKDLDRQRLINVLRKYSQNADGKDILISSEFIYHQVIKEKQRGLLFECIEECGLAFSKPSLITVFRNVFSHSVSAFCHRAGVHPLPQFDEWLKSKGTHSHLNYNYYEFFKELPLYLQLSKDSRFQTIPIQHSRTLELDFSQLFKCNLELQSITRVNPSPSTTQAEILRLMLNHNQPVRHVRNAFKNFSREHKEDDPNRVSWMYDNVQALVTASSEELALFADHSGFSISCRPATLPSLGDNLPLLITDNELISILQTHATRRSIRFVVKDYIVEKFLLFFKLRVSLKRAIKRLRQTL